MPRKPSHPIPTMPFMLWNDLALRTGEMLVASAQVIGHRTRRMAMAGHSPTPRDRREFTRMGMEKVEAANESVWAMGRHLTTMNAEIGTRAWKDMMAAATAWMSLVASRNLPQAIERQARLLHTMSESAASATKLSDATVRMTRRGLGPIHSRATANARRLGAIRPLMHR
jgi:hypothetical protein